MVMLLATMHQIPGLTLVTSNTYSYRWEDRGLLLSPRAKAFEPHLLPNSLTVPSASPGVLDHTFEFSQVFDDEGTACPFQNVLAL